VTPDSRAAFRIAPATGEDVPVILRLIKGLSDYEKMAADVKATEELLRETLFGKKPAAEVVIGYEGDEPVGFALFFQNYSTFMGRPGLYLEDLFVVPERRGRGYGRGLLQHLARIAVDRNYGRVEWAVLDWNEPAIGFYRSLGARSLDDWTLYRVSGDSLRTLAEK
jgi:GNAT superfamily N-acetyltransferase